MTASDDRPMADRPNVPPAHGDGPHGAYGGRAFVESDAKPKGTYGGDPEGTHAGHGAAQDDAVTDSTYGGGPAGPGATDAVPGTATDPDGTQRGEERTR